MPDWKEEITRQLASLKLPATREAEIVEEVAQHLDDRYRELLAGGATEENARLTALEEISEEKLLAKGLERTEHQELWEPMVLGAGGNGNILADLSQDVRYGLRMLRKNPGFTAVAVLTLALGIGANTAMFSVVNAVLLDPLPYQDAGRLTTLWETSSPFGSAGPGSVTDPDYVEWRTQNQVFVDVAAFHGQTFNLTGGADPERLLGAAASPNLFKLLGVNPALGRTFLPEEEQTGRGNVVLLSHQLWVRRFGSNPAIVGKSITLDGASFAVVGVMPPNFDFPNQSSIWSPLVLSSDNGNAMDQIVARLKPAVTLERARNDVAVIQHRLNEQHHRQGTDEMSFGFVFVFLKDAMVSKIRPALLILLASVSLVLLIACANVANLLLARATARQREISIRVALGATRGRILRQMLAESVLLAMMGGSLGLVLAASCRDSLVALLPQNLAQPGVLGRMATIHIDVRVLCFTFLASVGGAVLFGLVAGLKATSTSAQSSLKEAASTLTPSTHLLSVRNILVISEFALTFVLLVSAGLLIKSFVRLMEVDPGFQPERVLIANLELPSTQYQNETQMKEFHDSVMQRIAALPGVRAVGTVSFGLPMDGGGLMGDFNIEGLPEPPHLMVSKLVVSPGYFRALSIPLQQGREFDERDGDKSQPVAIVSESVARRFWAKGQAPGKRVHLGWSGSPWYSVVGVVSDVKQMGLDSQAPLAMYVPYSQAPRPFFLSFITIVARTDSDPLNMANALRHAVLAVDHDMPVFDVTSMEQLVHKSVSTPRFNALLLAAFASLALILAVVGIYGVTSYSVTQRTHEIGIRMAVGAERSAILRMIVRRGFHLAALGTVLGLVAALGLTRVLCSLLFGVQATDPLTYLTVAAALIGVSLIASYIPARRATKVDPLVALRYE
jgi:putative ABC transport system permease protein